MQELLLVNPRKRGAKRRKAASPAQKRARAAFAARARARSASAGTKRRKSVKRRKAAAPTLYANPRKRRSAVRSRRRRNPISGRTVNSLMKKPFDLVKPALVGAVGSIVVNNVLARVPLPAVMMTGRMRYVTQAVAAVGIAALAQKVGVKGATAAQAAEGSLTVTLRDAILDLAAAGGMPLAGMGYYLPGRGAGRAVPSRSANPTRMAGMSEYLTGPGSPRSNVVTMQGLARQRQKSAGFGF